MKKDLIKFGLETIMFQSKSFGKELQLLISELRQKPIKASEAQKNHLIRAIELLVLDRTGININLKVDTSIFAAIELPLVQLNHIFFSDFVKYFVEEEVHKNHEKLKEKEIINIDLRNSKITGPVSKIPSELYLSWDDLLKKTKFTDEEITAIMLHELGHAFTTFEYLDRMSTTNQALVSVFQEFYSGNKVNYSLELNKVAKKLFNDENKLNGLKDSDNPVVIASVILNTELSRTNSELGTPYYDTVSCEYLADQFVARHFYGQYLVSGLDKLYPGFSKEKSKGLNIFLDILICWNSLKMMKSILLAVTGAFTTPVAVLLVILNVFSLYLMYSSGKTTNNKPTYDDLMIRYKRVKEQLVLDLKNENYDAAAINEKIKNIDEIEKFIAQTVSHQPLLEKIITKLFSKEARAVKAIELQRDLEELASNKLFVQSAKLKTMT